MRLTDYDLRGIWRLPSQVRTPLKAAANAHGHRKRHPRAFLEKLAAAVQALNDFAGTHMVYRDSVHRTMTESGLTPDYPDCDEQWGEIGEGSRESIVHALDKCDATSYAIGNARALLRRMEQEGA
ncbi:hypothetical protein [Lysobacter sp. CFH 32150]|uniref:hypothetical protein n=1 Tax=Lysobacter sp. CFH 32150 TaxID=2927128 RepID=UPI001FA6E73F|nr:hypothetical protein [Lysobacter sp. CFH 32150]MCI4567209.1 hypothetical protein [Lysobacter sp. CFH 32150]